jgi:alpha-tubulin suppressor-like RCC1 family protein
MNVSSTYSGYANCCIFLAEDGKLYAWGSNFRHALGLDTLDNEHSPIELKGEGLYDDGGFKQLSSGAQHNLLLTNKSRIFAWGRNEDGQLGFGHILDVSVPTLVPFIDKQTPVQVACGSHFSVVLTEDGSLYSMGYNEQGQLGLGRIGGSAAVPTKIDLPPVQQVACGWSYTLALTKSGELYGWGYNTDGELGVISPNVGTPLLSPISNLRSLKAGPYHVLAMTTDQALVSWGWNYHGQESLSSLLSPLSSLLSPLSSLLSPLSSLLSPLSTRSPLSSPPLLTTYSLVRPNTREDALKNHKK